MISHSYFETRAYFDSDYPSAHHYKFDLCLSENPLGCSDAVRSTLQRILEDNILSHYPDRNYYSLRKTLAELYNIEIENFYIGAGVSGIIQDLIKAYIKPQTHILMADTTFPAPLFGATALGGLGRMIPLTQDYHFNFSATLQAWDFERTALIFLCNPNNPTGLLEPVSSILDLAEKVNVPVIVSEANSEFCPDHSLINHYPNWPNNLIVLRSFKAYGLAGLRIGYAIAHSSIITQICKKNHLFQVSNLAEQAAITALSDQGHVLKSVKLITQERISLTASLTSLGFTCIPSDSNVFVARLPDQCDSKAFLNALQKHDASVVPCFGYRSLGARFIRLAPRLSQINNEFINIVSQILDE